MVSFEAAGPRLSVFMATAKLVKAFATVAVINDQRRGMFVAARIL